jgi:hypothetical protein
MSGMVVEGDEELQTSRHGNNTLMRRKQTALS